MIFMLNKNIVHRIDDIFWNMVFKMETQADNFYTYYNYHINYCCCTNNVHHTLYTYFLQIHQDLGLVDHLWQDKRALIAQSVDDLGNQFRPAPNGFHNKFIHPLYLPKGRRRRCRPCCRRRDVGAARLSRCCCHQLRTPMPRDGWCNLPVFCNECHPKSQFFVIYIYTYIYIYSETMKNHSTKTEQKGASDSNGILPDVPYAWCNTYNRGSYIGSA
jgi:hypothetical protein